MRACCMIGGVVRAREADTRPPKPSTGYAHPKCYAASLNDCGREITGEHFLSRDVLEELGATTITVRGFPWQKKEAQPVGIASLQANILCDRHNSALSGLDAMAGRLFRSMRTVQAMGANSGISSNSITLFAGADFTRWMLKALMGLASARAARRPGGEPLPWSPPPLWLRILFGRVSFPKTWGLYVRAQAGSHHSLDATHVSIAPFSGNDGEINGCLVHFAGFEFALAMTDVGLRPGGPQLGPSVYRPDGLRFRSIASSTFHWICFGWSQGRGGGELQLDLHPPQPKAL